MARPPNVPLLGAISSLLDGIWGLFKDGWGLLVGSFGVWDIWGVLGRTRKAVALGKIHVSIPKQGPDRAELGISWDL